MIYEIVRAGSLFFLIYFFGLYSNEIGGRLWVYVTKLLHIPYFGKLYHFLFFEKVKISVLLKLVAWTVSSSGILIGLMVYYSIFGITNSLFENYTILIAAGIGITNFLYSTWYLEILDYNKVFSLSKDVVRRDLGSDMADIMEEDTGIQLKLRFANFIDTEIPRFLRYLVSVGVLYYSAYKLGFLTLKQGVELPPSLFQCIKYSLSFIPIEKVDQNAIAFEGDVWDTINIFFGLIVMMWALVFFNVALSPVSNDIENLKKSGTEEDTKSKYAELENNLGNAFSHFHNLIENISKEVKEIKKIKHRKWKST